MPIRTQYFQTQDTDGQRYACEVDYTDEELRRAGEGDEAIQEHLEGRMRAVLAYLEGDGYELPRGTRVIHVVE